MGLKKFGVYDYNCNHGEQDITGVNGSRVMSGEVMS